MNPFFKNLNIFLARKIHFSKKTFEKFNIFYKKFQHFFEKLFLSFSLFMIPYKSREIPFEFYYQIEKFIKKLKNSLDREGLFKMA